MTGLFARVTGVLLRVVTRLLTGASARWVGAPPTPGVSKVYFANHASHIDSVLIWTVLPPAVRVRTRPVAAADYWGRGGIRRFLIGHVFRGVLIERRASRRSGDPIEAMVEALDRGDSLILFPEGTRNQTDEMLPFKSGLYHLARARPSVDLVPVWIDNLSRVLPKGKALPVPLLCGVTFGEPTRLGDEEGRDAFLARARAAVQSLSGVDA